MAFQQSICPTCHRPTTGADSVYSDDYLTLDKMAMKAAVKGVPVDLTPTEWSVLETLTLFKGMAVSSQALLSIVWGPQYESDYLVKWHMSGLRRKLEAVEIPCPIETVRGYGYRYDA